MLLLNSYVTTTYLSLFLPPNENSHFSLEYHNKILVLMVPTANIQSSADSPLGQAVDYSN